MDSYWEDNLMKRYASYGKSGSMIQGDTIDQVNSMIEAPRAIVDWKNLRWAMGNWVQPFQWRTDLEAIAEWMRSKN